MTVDALVDPVGSEYRPPQVIVCVVAYLAGGVEKNTVILSLEPDGSERGEHGACA